MRRQRTVGLTLVALSTAGLWLTSRAGASTDAPASTSKPTKLAPAAQTLGALSFEPNLGQWDDAVRIAAHGNGYGLYLTRSEAVLALRRQPNAAQVSLTLRVVGARVVEPTPEGAVSRRSNYFAGSDASRFRSAVQSYARARYEQILPGVDWVFHATRAQELEYDLELRPGADPSALAVELEGVQSLTLADNHDALLRLSDGSTLRKLRPVAYQDDPRVARHFIPVEFRQLSATRLGFTLGDYDRALPLVIDPTLSYATYLGGSRFDEFAAVAADSSGNTYAVGYTTGTLFPTRLPAQPAYGGGASDVVVCKLNAAGNAFEYATYLGGSDTDRAYGVAVDAAGSAYITGITYSSNFPTQGALQNALGGGQDAFVTKLGPTGTLIYSTYLGGSGDDFGQGIALRPTGEASVVGSTFSTNFPTVSPFQATLNGTNDAFLARLSTAGSTLLSSTYLGGSGADYAQAIALDTSGNAFVVGQTGSSNFPTLTPAQTSFGGAVSDGFVTKLNPAGSALLYSTYLGGTSLDVATGVATAGGAAFVVGYTSSSNFPKVNASQTTLAGNSDAFLTRVNALGTSFDASTYLGGSAADSASSVTVDGNGFVYAAGQTASANFPIESALVGQATLHGASDAFLAGFSSGGSRLYSSYLGGGAADGAVGVAVGGLNQLHVLGNTFSSDFPTLSPFVSTPPGPQDGFIARLPTLSLTPAPAGPAWLWLCTAVLLFGAGLFASSQRRTSRFVTVLPHEGQLDAINRSKT